MSDRIKKVNILKKKILKEIDDRLKLFISEMDDGLQMEDFIFYVNESFSLHKLKLFIESEYSFIEKQYGIYIISEKNLDIWLQDDYCFVINYLILAEQYGYNIFPMLNDKYFQIQFTNIMDIVRWDNKNKVGE